MDANNITLSGFVYQGGDDCIAIKPRSYNIAVSNVTCRGGNGIAIGSLGQYQEDSSVENVTITDVKIVRYNEDMHNSAYIKTWMGGLVPQNSYESGGQPRALDTPPFFAIPICAGITNTIGGIAIDGHGRVKRPDGSVIAGLYAAGGATGGLEGGGALGYVGGLIKACVFGLRVAEDAARRR